MEYPVPDPLSVEQLSSRSMPASYVVYTDGTDIWAIPQDNPAGPDMDKVTGSDIGPLLDEIAINQLPPQGSEKEATGKVFLKRGEYPGDLANGTYNGLLLACQFVVEGEVESHYVEGETPATIPTTEPTVCLNTTGNGLVNPDVDNDMATFSEVRNLQLEGGTEGLALGANSNVPDWFLIENVVIQGFDKWGDWLKSDVGQGHIRRVHFRGHASDLISHFAGDRVLISESVLPMPDGGKLELDGGIRLVNSEIHAVGETVFAIGLLDHPQLTNVKVQKFGTTNIAGTVFRVLSGVGIGAGLRHTKVGTESGGGGFTNLVNDLGTGTKHFDTIITDPNVSVDYLHTFNRCTDSHVRNVDKTKIRDLGSTRPKVDGVLYGGPLGGTDLGALTGAKEYDMARADGTTAPNADTLYVFNGSDWVRVDGGNTITPA